MFASRTRCSLCADEGSYLLFFEKMMDARDVKDQWIVWCALSQRGAKYLFLVESYSSVDRLWRQMVRFSWQSYSNVDFLHIFFLTK